MMLKNFTCEADTLTSEGFISHTLSHMFLQGIYVAYYFWLIRSSLHSVINIMYPT